MDKEYDFIVLGTGLKECILSGLLSTNGFSVLHMDKNGYYGGESASLNLNDLFKKFQGKEKAPEDLKLGSSRDYNVDLCPKLLMACGNLVKTLLSTKVTRYLEFKSVAGSFVYKQGKIFKVPASGGDAWRSSLLGMMEKYRFKTFLDFVVQYDQKNAKTWPNKMDCTKTPMSEIYKYYKLGDNIQEFVGHAVCLYLDETYKGMPAHDTIERAKLYAYSVSRYGNSPYIYPVWGLGGLPEGFSRLCAVHGGIYMLNKPINKLHFEGEKIVGVESVDENGKDAVAKCKKGVLADPTYFIKDGKPGPEVKQVGQVARWICILDHPIPNTNNSDSCQIIIPSTQLKRKSDIYISCVSHCHNVAAKGHYIAMISAEVDAKDEAGAKGELKSAYSLLGKTKQEFFSVNPVFTSQSKDESGLFITESYDATTHWETTCTEVLSLYKRMTGKEVDLSIKADLDQE
uniref:Rab GDP dissociation inhibitor n=1 Tax=Lotharella globosa TaxID=91324 RepID=A0A7S3Z254_9EUKA|mmetsp:Transcript_7859/g.15344  ORF Transcript_7859/g.15344 Transcript_7859/m.15344 type:complete len:457 (-) Transcript_7859:208-1578(-)